MTQYAHSSIYIHTYALCCSVVCSCVLKFFLNHALHLEMIPRFMPCLVVYCSCVISSVFMMFVSERILKYFDFKQLQSIKNILLLLLKRYILFIVFCLALEQDSTESYYMYILTILSSCQISESTCTCHIPRVVHNSIRLCICSSNKCERGM